ncbi:MAG: ATP-binding protein [Anaerolineales bacterium]
MLSDIQVRQRDILLELARSITQELDLTRVLDQILRYSVELLTGEAGIIALHQAPGRPPTQAPPRRWRIAASYGLQTTFLRQLDPLLDDIPDQGDPQRFALPEINRRLRQITRVASLGVLTGLGLPLIARGEVVGVIFVFRGSEALFSPNERALLESFADQAAIAVANASLFTQVNEEKQRLDAILNSSAQGIAILGPDNRIQRFNRSLQKLTGYGLEEVLNQDHDQVIRFQRLETGISLRQAEAGGWPLSDQATLYLEGILIRKNGSLVSIGLSYAPVFSLEKNLINIVVGAQDLTRFRQAEELKSTFISIISHELKTPVALIKGYASTLRREDARWDPATIQDALSVIEQESDHLTSLIQDLLDASRLQAGGLELNVGEVKLDELASRLAERFSTQSPRHRFQVHFPDKFPVILGDEERLSQVISNLLSNAIKYSPPSTEVEIRGQVEPDQVLVTVSDQGPGIDPQDLPHVFDRFYRALDAARKTPGAGLGLYLARAVVEAHGGRIWADNEPQHGTRISFAIPRTQPLGQARISA